MALFTEWFGILLFGLLLLCIIINIVSSAKDMLWLSKHGVRVTAKVTDVKRKVNLARSPLNRMEYVVIAQWEDPTTQKVYTFQSDGRASYPTKCHPGSFISVLIDPARPQRYRVKLPA
jgi:hypothetical protein